MPIKTIDTYQIGLDLEQSDKTKQNIANLRSSFADAQKSLSDIEKEYAKMVETEGDHTAEAKEYNKLLAQRLKELDSEADKLAQAATEEGQKNRARMKYLQSVQKQRKLDKRELQELKVLEKSVLDIDQADIDAKKKQNLEARKEIKIAQTRLNAMQKEVKARRTLKKLAQDSVKHIKESVKAQLEFIKSLKTTEGRMKALQKLQAGGAKAAKAAASVGAKGGKAAAAGIGIAAGIVGGVVAGAESQVATEREARRLKVSGLSDDEKLKLISEMQIKVGGDAGAIVDAINRAASVVRTSNSSDLRRAALAEYEFPGSAALFAASGAEASADDMVILQNRLRAIQGATGANVGDISGIADSVRNLRDSRFQSGASQQDLIALQAALQGSGAYDSSEEIERAMRGFLAQKDLTRENFYKKMSEHDWSRYVQGSQNKNQADAFRKSFDFKALEAASNSAESTEIRQTAAEKAAETARKIAIEKDKLMQRILERIMPLMESGKLDKIIDNLFNVLDVVLPLLEPAMKALDEILEVVNKALEYVKPFIEKIADFFSDPKKYLFGDGEKEPQPAVAQMASGNSRAAGGIVMSPAIVGERGAELVLPLDYARAGRASNIYQNVQQTFNMTGNQTTALSLGNALRQRRFTDNLISQRMFGG